MEAFTAKFEDELSWPISKWMSIYDQEPFFSLQDLNNFTDTDRETYERKGTFPLLTEEIVMPAIDPIHTDARRIIGKFSYHQSMLHYCRFRHDVFKACDAIKKDWSGKNTGTIHVIIQNALQNIRVVQSGQAGPYHFWIHPIFPLLDSLLTSQDSFMFFDKLFMLLNVSHDWQVSYSIMDASTTAHHVTSPQRLDNGKKKRILHFFTPVKYEFAVILLAPDSIGSKQVRMRIFIYGALDEDMVVEHARHLLPLHEFSTRQKSAPLVTHMTQEKDEKRSHWLITLLEKFTKDMTLLFSHRDPCALNEFMPFPSQDFQKLRIETESRIIRLIWDHCIQRPDLLGGKCKEEDAITRDVLALQIAPFDGPKDKFQLYAQFKMSEGEAVFLPVQNRDNYEIVLQKYLIHLQDMEAGHCKEILENDLECIIAFLSKCDSNEDELYGSMYQAYQSKKATVRQ